MFCLPMSNTCVPRAGRGQKRAPESLELKLQTPNL